MSVLAMVLAGAIGWLLFLPASRNIMLQGGLLEADRDDRRVWRVILVLVWGLTRAVLVVLRAIPEFVWAFLFLLVFGPSLMAGVMALALHNGGILGKLASESLEDTDPKPLRALASLGSPPPALAFFGIGPRTLPQFLVYFFYRFETCLREAAILGLLGLATLGLFMDHAFARLHLDTALCFVMINSVLVIVGDLAGASIRSRIRVPSQ
jgi:phosphonate transport system permease protein